MGGNVAARASPTFNLGTLGNTITGLLAGGVLSQIVALLMLAITGAAQSGGLSIGVIVAQLFACGMGEAISTAIKID
ncbi:hypothetical protein [Falsiroseomonas sp. HW251]|uniref:hypothetical protein n=1 Tax=Falsiroseomonas sp. HW251 TaxID=3390998 RepID=UPI003D310B9E